MGFTVQLMIWYDRLYSEWAAVKQNPRVYQVCSFQKEQPHKVVCKFLLEKDLYKLEGKHFDSRGVYIVSVENKN